MAEAFQAVLSESQWNPNQYAETIRKSREEQVSWIDVISEKLGEIQEIIDKKHKVLQCEVSLETNSSDSYLYSQETDNNRNREILNLGNLSDNSSVKEEEIYPKRDETPKFDKKEQVLFIKPVSVMTINTRHLSEHTGIRTSINIPKNNSRKVKRNNSIKTNTKNCYSTFIPLSIDNPRRKEKLGKLTIGNHRRIFFFNLGRVKLVT